jgi:signal transduction histidine kinase
VPLLVRTELADDVPQIVGDRVQLQQVAMNLIVNSIEAMKDVDGIREMASSRGALKATRFLCRSVIPA